MAAITLEKSLLSEMSHIMGNEDLMEQTIKFVRSIRRKAKAEKAEWEYVPNAETRAAIEECESGTDLETLNITNFKDYVKSLWRVWKRKLITNIHSNSPLSPAEIAEMAEIFLRYPRFLRDERK